MRTTKQVLRQSEGLPELRLLASGRFQDLRILRNGSEVGKEEVAEVKRDESHSRSRDTLSCRFARSGPCHRRGWIDWVRSSSFDFRFTLLVGMFMSVLSPRPHQMRQD